MCIYCLEGCDWTFDNLIQSDLARHHGLYLVVWCALLNSFGPSNVLDWSTRSGCRGQAKGGLVPESCAEERTSPRLPPPNAFATPALGYDQTSFPAPCVLTLFLAEKFGLVKDIITKLALELRYLTKDEWDTFEMPRLPIEAFLDDQDSGPTGVCAVFGVPAVTLTVLILIENRAPKSSAFSTF